MNLYDRSNLSSSEMAVLTWIDWEVATIAKSVTISGF